MKYLSITKCIWNDGSYTWHLAIIEGFKNEYHSRKSNMLAEKIENIYNGECETVKHNNVEYEIQKSPFKRNNYNVYLVYRVNEKIPCFFWYKGYTNFETHSSLIIDEDIELFEKYGYIEKDNRI